MRIVSIGRQILSTFLHCLNFFLYFFYFYCLGWSCKARCLLSRFSILFYLSVKETRYIFFGQNSRCFWWPPMDALQMWPNVETYHNSYRIVHVTWSLTNDLAPPLFHPIRHGMIKDHLGHLHLSADRESVRPIVFFTSHGIIRGTASSSLHYCSSISRLKSLLCPI